MGVGMMGMMKACGAAEDLLRKRVLLKGVWPQKDVEVGASRSIV